MSTLSPCSICNSLHVKETICTLLEQKHTLSPGAVTFRGTPPLLNRQLDAWCRHSTVILTWPLRLLWIFSARRFWLQTYPHRAAMQINGLLTEKCAKRWNISCWDLTALATFGTAALLGSSGEQQLCEVLKLWAGDFSTGQHNLFLLFSICFEALPKTRYNQFCLDSSSLHHFCGAGKCRKTCCYGPLNSRAMM